MATPDMIFDVVLFGALVVAMLVDRSVPSLSGGALLVVTGIWTYLSAIDLSDWLRQKKVRVHESLLTSLAISVLGVIYYTTHWRLHLFSRPGENLVLLGLSIVLMMTALMAAISVIAMVADWRLNAFEYGWFTLWCGATVGVCYWLWNVQHVTQPMVSIAWLSAAGLVVTMCASEPKRGRVVLGLLATLVGGGLLGLAASYVVLLAMPPQKPLLMFILPVAAFVVGKVWVSRHWTLAPPPAPPRKEPATSASDTSAAPEGSPAVPSAVQTSTAPAAPAASKIPALPLRGWILPRFAAVLMLAPILFYLFKGG